MKARLSFLYFLQFSIWGCYLTCLGQFLGSGGLGSMIPWFYAAVGIVSIFTPSLFGRIADKISSPQRLLALCHLSAGIMMLMLWRYAMTHQRLDFSTTFLLYVAFLAFYMPTMALANTVSFRLLDSIGQNTVTSFPKIRIWGTVGFIAAMWFVNSAYWLEDSLHFTLSDSTDAAHLRFQYNAMQLLCSGVMAFLTSAWAYFLPSTPIGITPSSGTQRNNHGLFSTLKTMLGIREVAIFLVFVIFSGVCLQISNGYATPYITHFMAYPEFSDSLAAGNATMLFSLSQISEAFCILLVGISLKWKGIRWVYAIGLLAWSLRFLFLGLGNPGDGLWLLIGSMLVYGIAFNFITIAGHLYIQQIVPANMKGFAQGVMMFMSNGIGATTGIFIAGMVVNHWCHWQMVEINNSPMRLFMGVWQWPWIAFAAYASVVAVTWIIVNGFIKKAESATPITQL